MADAFNNEQHDGTIFQDAVDALRRGDRPRAKELLTLLLKNNQTNSTYWVWMSAAVDNTKERIYCLQTALKLDPENGTAKRGLILLGALTPDDTIQPFPMNRPRAWEEKLLLANEQPKEKGLKVITKNPVVRLVGLVLIAVALCAVVVFGFVLPRRTTVKPTTTFTPGPSPTFTTTPTLIGATAPATPTYFGPTPLWMLLPQTYTPTAVYVNTPLPPEYQDQFRVAKDAYAKGDWDAYIQNMQLILQVNPNLADIHYYIGEAYRFKGNPTEALKAYNDALKVDPDFGAPYLGLARARLMQDPNANIKNLFDEAIKRDPNFGEIYLERGNYFTHKKDYEAALKDLDKANELMPGSPQVSMAYAQTYLAKGDKENGLKYAEEAYSRDITILEVYPLLGQLYIENGEYQRGIDSLELDVVYEPENANSFALLGQGYFMLKDYKSALKNLDTAYKLNPNGLRRFYVYRGLANLELKNADKAVEYLEKAFDYDEKSFETNLGLAQAYYLQGTFGNAYLKLDSMKSLAETDEQKALVFYWLALTQEKRNSTDEAIKAWQELLALDKTAMTSAMRSEAEKHLSTMVTSTNTPKPGTRTPTPKASFTATPTKASSTKATSTPTPTKSSKTPTPTPTK
ncbi:MAG: tetratricopeptide repeat protein [Anaerolineales bacterium]